MPPRRGPRRAAAPLALQSKLSFHGNAQNRVTKASQSHPNLGKTSAKTNAPSRREISQAEVRLDGTQLEPSTADRAIAQQAETEASTLATSPPQPNEQDPFASTLPVKIETVLGGQADPSTLGATNETVSSGFLGDEEAQARSLPTAQIHRYWRAKETERLAPRVHQEGLTISEKILREWDMSGQYGPCIGIARLKRWKRANALGLRPPIEVLAVLLSEMDGEGCDVGTSQRAYVDQLMSSRFATES